MLRLTHVNLRTVLALWVFCLTLLLLGCGGGGGGGTTGGCEAGLVPSTLVYSTTWSDTPGSGASQYIQLLDADLNPVAGELLNKSSGTSLQISQFNSGLYILQADLYSQADGTGTLLGSVRTLVLICGSTNFATEVGGVVAKVRIQPTGVTFRSDQSKQFYAAAYTAFDAAVFVPDGAFTWSVLGGIATINQNGLAIGAAAGAGSVRALHKDSGFSGTASVDVTPFTPTRSKWTVLVFLNAANDLYLYSDPNVNQMERVADNPDLRFVLQWKQSRSIFQDSSFTGTRRYLVKPDATPSVVSELIQDMGPDVDMGDPQVLNDFITWGQTNYPADHYVLVLWNHGSGWKRGDDDGPPVRAFSFDDETGSSIDTWEIPAAMAGKKVDIVAWDTSLMQMLEVAYELRTYVDYIAGSEESPPGEGYPYDLVFKPFRDNPSASPAALSKGFVDGMLAYTPYNTRKITQSVIDTSKLDEVATALSDLGTSLIANNAAVATAVKSARANAQSYSPSITRNYRDIQDVLEILLAAGLPIAVQNALANLDSAVKASVLWEGHNSNSPGSTGLSFDFSPGGVFSTFGGIYGQTKLGQDTTWDEFLLVSP